MNKTLHTQRKEKVRLYALLIHIIVLSFRNILEFYALFNNKLVPVIYHRLLNLNMVKSYRVEVRS